MKYVNAELFLNNAYYDNVLLSYSGTGAVYTGTYTYNISTNTTQMAHVFTALVYALDSNYTLATLPASGSTALTVPGGPAISNAALTPASIGADGGALAISATITDAGSSLYYWDTTCAVYEDGYYLGSCDSSSQGANNVWYFNYNIGANTGTTGHIFTASITAQDALGLSASLPASGATAQPAETGPVVSNATLTPPSLSAAGGTLAITATVTDAESTLYTYGTVCQIYEDGNYIGDNQSYTQDTNNVWYFNYNIGANSGGAKHVYTAVVVAVDYPGLQASQAATGSCTQCFATGGPVITAASASPSALPATGGTVTVSANVAENDSGGNNLISNVSAWYFIDGIYQGYLYLNYTGSGTTYTTTCAFGNNTKQAHTITFEVNARDNLGNNASCMATPAVSYAADTTPPVISNIVLTPSTLPVAGGTLAISATVTDNGANSSGVSSVQALLLCNNVQVSWIGLNNGGSGSSYSGS